MDASHTPPPLDVEQLHVTLNGQPILNDITLTLQDGAITGLIGLNGMGKTTLLKAVLGLIPSHTATIRLYGQDARQPESRRHVCFIPEKFQPSPLLTGYDVVRLTLSLYGLPYEDDRVMRLLDQFSLPQAAYRAPIKRYSKGMVQKLGLIAAFASERSLLILDEPMSGLDPLARQQVRQALIDYRNRGHSVLFSSHLLGDVESLCDEIIIIHEGCLRYAGSVTAFRAKAEDQAMEEQFLASLETA